MTAPRTDMHRLQELVRLHRMGTGKREVARLLKMSPKTEGKYRRAFVGACLLDGSPTDIPALDELKLAVESAHPSPPVRSYTSSVDRWMPTIETGFNEGVEAKAVWDKLQRTDSEFDATYAAVVRAYRRLRKRRGPVATDVTIPVTTAAGEVAQVDFGYAGKLLDPETNELRKAWAFVMVLGHSRHMFAKVVFDQRAETWLHLHVAAFHHFGGCPKVIVPDNLKAAVIRGAFGSSDRHAIGLNRTYRELARHYGFKIDPTPTYAPQKKGKVESAVRYVKRNALKTRDSNNIDEVNEELDDWVMTTAGLRVHGSTGRVPLSVFEAEEQSALMCLPTMTFQLVVWKEARVSQDCHVLFDRRLYSVPWRLVETKVFVRASSHTVDVFADDVRVATHDRRGTDLYVTHDAHLPEFRRDLRHRSDEYWQERAQKLSTEVGNYVANVFASDDVLSKLADVQAIVLHLETFPLHRIKAAVARADFYANYTFRGVRKILADELDFEPLPTLVVPADDTNELPQPRFARTTAELLAKHLETNHESH